MFRVLPLLVAICLSGCSKATPTTENATTAAAAAATPAAAPGQTLPAPAAKPVPAELPAVIARVNGEEIQKAEFEKAVESFEASAGGPVPADHRDQVLRSVLDQMISYKLLVQEARNRRLTVTDVEVNDRIGQIRAQFPTEEAFTQALAAQKTTLAQLRNDSRSDMLVNNMLESEIGSKVKVTPAQADDFYAKNPTQFKQPERVRASHILIGFPQDADAAAKAAARAKAVKVLAEVKSGKDFAALAKQYSSDPGSAANGGDLGLFQQGQMVGPFDKAAFSMKEGQTSDLVETQFGFHIIRVIEKLPTRDVPLEEVRGEILQFLEGREKQQATQSFVGSLKTKGKIEIFM